MANGKIDKALQQLFKQSVKLVKLWENASPASAFPAQKISLDLSPYDFIEIFKKAQQGITGTVMFCGKTGGAVILDGIGHLMDTDTMVFFSRNADITETGIQFGNGMWRTAAAKPAVSNGNMLPMEIYGVKLIGGGYNLALKIRHFLCRRGCIAW